MLLWINESKKNYSAKDKIKLSNHALHLTKKRRFSAGELECWGGNYKEIKEIIK